MNGQWQCATRGGAGADIQYVRPADNRGAGSWVSNALHDYPDGVRVLFEIPAIEIGTPIPPVAEPSAGTSNPANVNYASCAEVKAAGAALIKLGDPGYSLKLDRDGDGAMVFGTGRMSIWIQLHHTPSLTGVVPA